MPKQPKNKSGLRTVRKATGLNQSSFAMKIGCSFGTLHSLELGRLNLSPAMARQVHYSTGCGLKWKTRTKPEVVAKDWTGADYTAQSYQQWQVWCKTASEQR